MKPQESDEVLVTRLRSGDETAFAALVDDLHGRLLALARTFTSSPALAEDIVQETWLGVIRGLRGFEGRSALRTWIVSILVRRARTLAARESRRSGAPKRLTTDDQEPGTQEWEPGAGRVGLWTEKPVPWGLVDPAVMFQTREALEVVQKAVAELPERQRQVLLLRDVEDMEAEDVCNILEVSETNLRVLLHRGRARVRRAMDHYVREGARPAPSPRASGTRSVSPEARPTRASEKEP